MNVFITGADGLLGSNVVRELINRSYNVTALVERGKESKTLEGLPITKVEGNILEGAEMKFLLRGIDMVIHCAACTNIWPAKSLKTRRVNIQGTQNVVNACLENNISRAVFIGTANSFGKGSKDQPGTEQNPYAAGVYGLDYMDSKREAQNLVLKAVHEKGLPAIVVNPTFMIGPQDAKPSSGAMILALLQKKVPCSTPGGKNYINVKDAAIGVVNALTMGQVGEAYILGNENLSFKEMFTKVGTVLGANVPKRTLPSGLIKLYGKLNSILGTLFKYAPAVSSEMAILSCEDHYYSADKAVEALKLPQTPIENGILDCYEWFVEHGYYTPKEYEVSKLQKGTSLTLPKS